MYDDDDASQEWRWIKGENCKNEREKNECRQRVTKTWGEVSAGERKEG